jgi:hypothetical protein
MNNDEKIQKILEAEFQYCKKDIVYLINNYCPIEDKDAPEVIVPMKLWKEQEQLVRDYTTHKLNITLKARQLGITWCALFVGVYTMFNAGSTVIALSKTDDDAKELVRRVTVILNYMPQILKGGGLRYENNAGEVRLIDGNGKTSIFKAFPSSQGAGRSFTANLLIIDEWAFQQWAEEIWTSTYPTINRPTGGRVIGLSTIKRGTLFEKLVTDKTNGFHKSFLGVFTDPKRTQEWYEETEKNIGALIKQEYPRTMQEALEVIGGRLFDKFSEAVHIVPPFELPKWWAKHISIDYGYDMLDVGFYMNNNAGKHYQVAEIHISGLEVAAAAQEINKKKEELGWQNEYVAVYMPQDLFNRNPATGKNIADEFNKHNIYGIATTTNKEAGVSSTLGLISPYMDDDGRITSKLQFFNTCPHTIRCVLNILRDEKNERVYADKPHELTHSVTRLNYYSVQWGSSAKEPKEEKPKTAKEQLRQMGARRVC